ncbi:hypothetical protein FGO68_gene15886 [Halteria grandinella]|uniref:Uncharacterized protein n=1 Tax=Halteria grandinella TaxID=5974 RepID=A0A8J8NG65_HALGN|nr:hypothetical protein FGO68_gene15886 [Halteria grandinella]
MFKKWFGGGSSSGSSKNKKNSPRGASAQEYGFAPQGNGGLVKYNTQYDVGYGGRRQPRVTSINLESDLPSSKLQKQINGIQSTNVTLQQQIQLQQQRKQRELPPNFAKSLIDCEIQVARPDATSEQVQKLMDLYTVAIEHYNSLNDFSNQAFYQSKLTGLLTKDELKHHLQTTVIGGARKASDSMKVTPHEQLMSREEQKAYDEQQKAREKYREKQKFQDAMKLTIFNSEKQTTGKDTDKEIQLEEHKKKQEEALKLVEREQLLQQEQFKKRLAERKRISSMNRSMNSSLGNQLGGLLLNKGLNNNNDSGVKKVAIDLNDQQAPQLQATQSVPEKQLPSEINANSDQPEFFQTLDQNPVSKPLGLPSGRFNRLNSSTVMRGTRQPLTGPSLSKPTFNMNNSYMSDAKSVRTTGGGLANRLTSAISLLARSKQTTDEEQKHGNSESPAKVSQQEEEIADLESLIQEFNSLQDLTVKLNSQVKICKIIEANEEICYSVGEESKEDLTVRQIMDECKSKLQELAEEKVMGMLEIKQRYGKQLTLLKVSAAKPGNEFTAQEKIRAMEDKKRGEEQELQHEISNKKAGRLQEIKQKYNDQAKEVTINVEILKQALARVAASSAQCKHKEEEIDNIEVSVPLNNLSKKEEVNEYGLDSLGSYKAQHRESTGIIGERRR